MSSVVVKKTEFRVRIAWDCKQARVVGGEVEDCNEEENVGLRTRIWLCDGGKGIRRNSWEPKKWGWDWGEGSGCKEEKEDCTGKKRIERRKVQLSPPKAKSDAILAGLQENVSNPVQDWRGGYVKLFGGKDDHAPEATPRS